MDKALNNLKRRRAPVTLTGTCGVCERKNLRRIELVPVTGTTTEIGLCPSCASTVRTWAALSAATRRMARATRRRS